MNFNPRSLFIFFSRPFLIDPFASLASLQFYRLLDASVFVFCIYYLDILCYLAYAVFTIDADHLPQARMATFELYRRSTIGMCLTETLDEMVQNGTLSPEIAIQVLVQFDKVLSDGAQFNCLSSSLICMSNLIFYFVGLF